MTWKFFIFAVLAKSSWGFTVNGDIFFLFIGSNSSDTVNTTLNYNFSSLIGTRFFSTSKPTVLYTHGFQSGFKELSAQTVVGAYLSRNDHNIIVIDWSKYAGVSFYPEVTAGINDISKFVVNVLVQMQTASMDLKTFHLVGHSLGAQLFGRVGYNFLKTRNFKITRITGLDPAGPTFVNINEPNIFIPGYPTLNKENAALVDIIHTDAGILGSVFSAGHKDFWPNRGLLQPGCFYFDCVGIGQDDCSSCNHGRAWKYYAESVKSQKPTAFTGTRCLLGTLAYIKMFCPGPATSPMGFYADTSTATGNFFVQTKDRSLYSL